MIECHSHYRWATETMFANDQIRYILCHVVSDSDWAFFSYDYEPSSLTTIFSYDYESYSPKALINIVVG